MLNNLKQFVKDTSGNFASMFAISMIPLFGLAGMAIDYSSASRIKTQMQIAADAAALSAIVEFHQGGNRDQQALATDFFNANYNGNVPVSTSTSLNSSQNEIQITSDADVPTTLLGILGKSKFDVTVTSKASIETINLQIALALDTTGSMGSNGKMALLQEAAKDFVDNILPLSGPTGNLVEFAVVPFSTVVKIDSSNANQWWMDLNGIAEADFEGCVWDRSSSLDSIDSNPEVGDSSTFYQASPTSLYETSICSSKTQILPLSQSRYTIKDSIDDLTADGNTNTAIGMVWAKNVLSDSLPFSNSDTNTRKIIVFLTDGQNTDGRIMAEGGITADIDAATLEACTEAKDDNIQIYSVRVIDGNAAVLQSCASTPAKYFDISSASQLDDVFQEISDQIWQSMIALKQ